MYENIKFAVARVVKERWIKPARAFYCIEDWWVSGKDRK